MLVADKLGIPFQTVDLSEQYKERIVDYMFHEYEKGRTPNPDVLCNREIKFDVFMKIALDLGADYVATGHYCRKGTIEKEADANKDQSYFLCQLSQEQLAKSLFPIGELTKPEVREIATKLDLVTADKKDSQGLCFIGKVKLPDFLQQQLKPKEGVIVEIPENGKVVGKHQGAHYFTKGQRKGLAVGGTIEPLFVIDTDVNDNVIYTGQGKDHPGLYKRVLFVNQEEVHWIREDLKLKVDESMEVMARIRYRQDLETATLHQVDSGLYVEFQELQSAITEGQFVAWYQDDELLGSGVIS
ncbi:UNVERIFIED_CONTAM: hypothetical protein GTU68_015971 [Idotea baltica]|nr:hypothetical protein [Idotea baltica]